MQRDAQWLANDAGKLECNRVLRGPPAKVIKVPVLPWSAMHKTRRGLADQNPGFDAMGAGALGADGESHRMLWVLCGATRRTMKNRASDPLVTGLAHIT